jgi:hypothetical protein
MNDKTQQYVTGMAGMTILGIVAILDGGQVGMVIATAVAGGIGFHMGSHGSSAATTATPSNPGVPKDGGLK